MATEVKKELKRIYDNVTSPEIELLRTFPSRKAEKDQFVLDNPQIHWDVVPKDKSGSYYILSKQYINFYLKFLF